MSMLKDLDIGFTTTKRRHQQLIESLVPPFRFTAEEMRSRKRDYRQAVQLEHLPVRRSSISIALLSYRTLTSFLASFFLIRPIPISLASRLTALIKLKVIKTMTRENGKATIIMVFCNACRPPE